MFLEFAIFAAVFFLAAYYFTQKRPPNFPPGPSGVPVLGYLPFLGLPPQKGLRDLSKKYGNIFSIYFANYPIVFLSEVNLIKDTLKDERFAGRPDVRPLLERSWGKKRGIIFGEGKEWQEMRRFALKNLRDFGFGKGSMETLIMDEVLDLISQFKKELNHPISIKRRFNAAVLNSLWHIISGERYEQGDPKLNKIINILSDEFEKVEISGPIFFMPWLTKLFPEWTGWNQFIGSLVPTFAFFQETIDYHKRTFNKDNLRDFIDVFLQEISVTEDKNSGFHKDNGDKSLLIVLLDLFAAGADTTSTTLNWVILYLIMHPEIQENVYKEINEVVGKERMPSLNDRPRMPYMEAFIAETLRYSSIAPLSVFHATTETIKFHGYTLPKGTIVMPNMWQVHHDPEYWGDPSTFRPERFLTSDGHYKKDDNIMAFSTGRRVCLGESLARDEIFLFTSSLLHQFKFEKENHVVLSDEPSMSPIQKPKDFNVVIRQR